MSNKIKENKKILVTYHLVINFFVEMFALSILGFFLGRYLDRLLFEDKQLLAFILLFLGLITGLVNFIKRVLKTIDDGGDDDEKNKRN